MRSNPIKPRGTVPGFTLVEMMLAGVLAAFILGAVTASLGQLGRARTSARRQLEAHLRADAAISSLRRDIINVLRDPDLFWTRLVLTDQSVPSPLGTLDRDEILLFDAQLRPIRDLAFIGEGEEFETQYRIDDDVIGPVLWQRRDAVPDEYAAGGGVATPIVEGVVSVAMEAYDGISWQQEWDSDIDGLPRAVRVTVMASGGRPGDDPYGAPLSVLRTIVPIDRVPLPPVPPEPDEVAPTTEQPPDAAQPPETLLPGPMTPQPPSIAPGRQPPAPTTGGRNRGPRGGAQRGTGPRGPPSLTDRQPGGNR